LKEKLNMAILNDKKCKIKGRLHVSKDLSKTIFKEIAVFKEERTCRTYLQSSYEYLKPIKPTNVDVPGFLVSGTKRGPKSLWASKAIEGLFFLSAFFLGAP
jgi:hypothetical protein